MVRLPAALRHAVRSFRGQSAQDARVRRSRPVACQQVRRALIAALIHPINLLITARVECVCLLRFGRRPAAYRARRRRNARIHRHNGVCPHGSPIKLANPHPVTLIGPGGRSAMQSTALCLLVLFQAIYGGTSHATETFRPRLGEEISKQERSVKRAATSATKATSPAGRWRPTPRSCPRDSSAHWRYLAPRTADWILARARVTQSWIISRLAAT